MEHNFINLLDILPPLGISKSEGRHIVYGVQEYLQERGRTECSADEVAFVALLDQYIDIFTKAKSMVANEKFTVNYKGEQHTSSISLTDFEIVPIVKKRNG